jgi:hypothetical protein
MIWYVLSFPCRQRNGTLCCTMSILTDDLSTCARQLERACPGESSVVDDDTLHGITGQVLEVKAVDAMLELSYLTDDSRLNLSLEETKGEKSVLERPQSLFETPQKSRTAAPEASTPDTAPMDDDDAVSYGSKYKRHSESAVTLRVDDYKVVTFEKLIRRLEGNSYLETVEIYRLRNVSNKRTRTYEELAHFFTMLRGLPHLKTLILNNCSRQDLGLISFMVKEHKTLEKIHIHLTSSTVESSLLDVLAEAPALKEVSLDVQASFPLHLLLTSPTLTRITVPSETFQFEERHLVFAMNALGKNGALRTLDLKPKLKACDMGLLAFGIRDNAHLQVLRFSFLADEKDAGPALIQFCGALSKNSSLRTVENHYAKLLRVKQADAFRIQTAAKKSLKTVEIFSEDQEKHSESPSQDNNILSKLIHHSSVSLSYFSEQATRCFRPEIDDSLLQQSMQKEASNDKVFSAATETSGIRGTFVKMAGISI